MAETINKAKLATEISNDIFKLFKWHAHPHKDENFDCVRLDSHFPSKGEPGKDNAKKPDVKKTHPTDVVFDYFDPYLAKKIYLLSDLKSYSKDTLKNNTKIRSAIISLAKSIDCAEVSEEWKSRYVIEDEAYEIRGMLFVYNHDSLAPKTFSEKLAITNFSTLPLRKNSIVHVLGPEQITQLLSIAADMAMLQIQQRMHKDYSFLYPDLVQWKRNGDPWDHAATIELLTAPYLIVKHRKGNNHYPDGYMIYYAGPGKSFSEFIFLIDTLSRFQILGNKVPILLRMISPDPTANYQNNFAIAKSRYIQGWGMDEARKQELELFEVSSIKMVLPMYSALDAGWRD